jgi:DNA-binding MarR family transcriptional regulator
MMMRLAKRHLEILERIGDGWTPFPFQLSGLQRALLHNGLVETTHDSKGNVVLVITEAGRALLAEGAARPEKH